MTTQEDEALVGFMIEGVHYPIPALDSFDNNELMLMYDYTGGLTQEDFAELDDETEEEHTERVAKLMRHPGFWTTLMHVAYARGNPGERTTRIKALIGTVNRLEALTAGEDKTEDPTQNSTQSIEPSFAARTDSVTESSGDSSDEPSAPQGNGQSRTGVRALPSSATSDRETSAA